MENHDREAVARVGRRSETSKVLAVLITLLCLGPVLAETDLVILHGSGTISKQGRELVVSVSDGAILDCDHFELPASNSILIRQPLPTSSLSIRIHDSGIARICGEIHADGRLSLTNSGGILFGEGSKVEAGEFTALSGSGSLVNSGRLIARQGWILLSGPEVRQLGSLQADSVGSQRGGICLQANHAMRLGASSSLRAGGADNAPMHLG